MPTENEWLKKLKAGDEVIVSYYRFNEIGDTAKVLRVTTTQIQVERNHKRFSRTTGRRLGENSYQGAYLIEATPERKAAIDEHRHRSNMAFTLGQKNWRELPIKVLEDVTKILEQHKKEGE